MKPRLVLWGNDAQNERVLIALELRPEDNKVNIYTFPENVVTEEFHQKMMDEWRDGTPLDFPEGYTESERELTVSDDLLPEELKVERTDVVQRAQTEWHFMVLSTKLNDAYHSELDELKDRVEKLESYDSNVWDELKGFWDKVQTQVRDRNLLREHSDNLRDSINGLFAQMKELRAKLDAQFDKVSEENHERFMETLGNIEKKISDGLRLAPIFDELKDIQRKFRDSKLSREHRSEVWERLDAAFKTVKEKRFGPESGEDRSPVDRLQRRYDGLLAAIEKMERSIKRDRDDLDFQSRKIERTDGQLEAQIRQAKIKMIEERIRSKEEKLGEMMHTKAELEQRMAQQKKKEEEREKIEEAKKAAQKKIEQEMKEREQKLKEEEDKLVKAAEQIVGDKPQKEEEETEAQDEESKSESVEAKKEEEDKPTLRERVEDAIEDVVDTVKAVAEVIEDKVEDAIEELTEGDEEDEEEEEETKSKD